VIDWTAAADATRRVGRAIEVHDEIGSTNDRARELLDGAGPDGVAVLAERQTAGRGRRGRVWQSPAGLNLTVSVGLRPRLPAERAGLLGIAAVLAVRRACSAETSLLVKWPNDVVDGEGLKVAGLLLETSLVDGQIVAAVIGMGINVNWRRARMPVEVAASATSLADIAGRDLDRVDLLRRLLTALDDEIAALDRRESPVERFAAVSWLRDRDVLVSLGERSVAGHVTGVATDGSLLLDAGDGPLALSVGEVVQVRSAPGRSVQVPAQVGEA
jgi:BirA family biotin operon repressor/biotin-[acetyl-CoA-carboxylase] ligase